MSKKLAFMLSMILAFGTIFGSGATAASWPLPLRVVVDNEPIYFPDAKPYSDTQNRTQVPIRFVGEALGAKVTWDAESRQAIFEKDSTRVVLTIDKRQYEVNGKVLTMDTEAVASNGRTYVPARYVAEALGAEVEWDPAVRTVYIWTGKGPKVKDEGNVQFYDGIAFNPETDVRKANGELHPDKLEEFTLNMTRYIRFVKEDGKYVVKGSYPEIPEGYEWNLYVHVQTKDGLWYILGPWEPWADHVQQIPRTGSFSRVMPISSYDDIYIIELVYDISRIGTFNANGWFLVHVRENEEKLKVAKFFNYFTGKFSDYTDRFPFDEMFKWK